MNAVKTIKTEPPLNLLREAGRLEFVLQRDKLEEAVTYAHRMIKVYRGASLNQRRKNGKNATYRRMYVEAAMSFRHLLRTNFLQRAASFYQPASGGPNDTHGFCYDADGKSVRIDGNWGRPYDFATGEFK